MKPRPSILGKLHQWEESAKECNKCDISYLCTHKVFHSTHIVPKSEFTKILPTRVDILFIGEAPGQVEYAEKEPFIGPSGIVLRDIIDEVVHPSLTYTITNSILCTPFTDDTRYDIRAPSPLEIENCASWLITLCRKLRPRKLIALGKVANKSIERIRMKIPIPIHITLLYPSMISQSSKYQYEFDKATLQIKQYLADISPPPTSPQEPT